MNNHWKDDSNDVLEFYATESTTGSALVVRVRGEHHGYAAYVFRGFVQCADDHFASLREAQAWAEATLSRPFLERSVGA